MKAKIVYITMPNFGEARRIGLELVEKKLCACINIVPNISSMYLNEGKTEEINEALLLCKTEKEKLAKITKTVKEMHSYETPCIKAIDAEQLNQDYAKWMKKVMK
ncbi:MAG: divalent-cation tolerance protein CutA [Candidatus Diapherotrites archaeon]